MPHHPLSGPYIDDPSIPDTYVNSFEARLDMSENVRVDLCAQRWNPDDDDKIGRRVVVGRLVMSVSLAAALRDALWRLDQEYLELHGEPSARPRK